MSTEVGRSTTLPASLKFCSVPYPLEGIVPRNSFPAPVTLPPNVKVCSVPCPPRRAVPPHFRHASAEFENVFRSVSTAKYLSAKLIFRFRHVSSEPQFSSVRFYPRGPFRQPHFLLPLLFRAVLDFVPFRVLGPTYFRDDNTCVQTNTIYMHFVWIHPTSSHSPSTLQEMWLGDLSTGDGPLLGSQSPWL